MIGEVLVKLYKLNFMVIEENLADMTHEESLHQPPQAGNCLNWVMGHIVANRNLVMALVGDAPLLGEEETGPYNRGSAPLTDGRMSLPLEKLLDLFRESQEKLVKRLQEMSEEELMAPVENGTRLEQLALLQFHEAYHAGQLGILRRLGGKPGAIT